MESRDVIIQFDGPSSEMKLPDGIDWAASTSFTVFVVVKIENGKVVEVLEQ